MVIASNASTAITRERIAKSYRIHCHLADCGWGISAPQERSARKLSCVNLAELNDEDRHQAYLCFRPDVFGCCSDVCPCCVFAKHESNPAADKPSDYLSANQHHMGFDMPANPNVECLAAIQAVFAFYHRRVSRNALTLTGPRILSCATSNKPIQMMSGK